MGLISFSHLSFLYPLITHSSTFLCAAPHAWSMSIKAPCLRTDLILPWHVRYALRYNLDVLACPAAANWIFSLAAKELMNLFRLMLLLHESLSLPFIYI